MIRNKLLIGISLSALSAGTAVAQNTDNTDANGNREVISCTAGNSCDVDNQFPGNDRNFGAVIARGGTANNLLVTQRGDDNSATIEANGSNNFGRTNQTGDDHRSDVDQTGNGNSSTVDQSEEDNVANVVQVSTRTSTSGTSNTSTIAQGTSTAGATGAAFAGENNQASVNQNGQNLASSILQGANNTGGPTADNNSATVRQSGNGSSSTVTQTSSGNIARVGMFEGGTNAGATTLNNRLNSSSITQRNTRFQAGSTSGSFVSGGPTTENNPNTGNIADVAISGQQNSSSVSQDGVRNTAIVSMIGGGPGNTFETADTSVSANVGPNGTSLPANRREGNTSDVTQTGRSMFYEISIGRNPNGGAAGRGNVATIVQGGSGADATAQNGRDHQVRVWQRGTADTLTVNQQNNAQGGGGSSQFGSIADVSQLSFGSTATITQTGTNLAVVSQALNADNSGGQNDVTVTQNDAGDTDTSGAPATDPFGGTGSGSTVQRRNFAEVSQSGTGNSVIIDQNAINARADVFQPRQSLRNASRIRQGTGQANAALGTTGGTGSDARDLVASMIQAERGSTGVINQDGRNLNAAMTQGSPGRSAQSGNDATITQVARFNSATLTQSGFGLSANVTQRGTGESGFSNLVSVQQTGNGHSANARQLASVGPTPSSCGTNNASCPQSGNPSNLEDFPNSRTAGVRYSAEIRIIQAGSTSGTSAPGNTGNSATVEQQGLGQYAEINQNGRGNTAGILQGTAATNAVAIIRQTGDGNTFFITQNAPGQYMMVTQNGSNNSNTTTVASGPTNTGGGLTVGGTTSTGSQPGL